MSWCQCRFLVYSHIPSKLHVLEREFMVWYRLRKQTILGRTSLLQSRKLKNPSATTRGQHTTLTGGEAKQLN